MTVKIYVDNRESPAFLTKIKNAVAKKYEKYTIQLKIGDIVITKNGKICVVIERKTVADFVSSHFCDGRGKEQIWRLRTYSDKNTKIIYLIEGTFTKKNIRSIPVNSIQQSITNIRIRDGISVIVSKNMTDSAKIIERICKCLTKYDVDMETTREDSIESTYRYVGGKSKTITPDIYFKTQLRLIPGIGKIISQSLIDKYKSLYDIIMDCKKNPENIYNITYGCKVYKIGKKRGDIIINFLCNNG